jgi:hypothetical protein
LRYKSDILQVPIRDIGILYFIAQTVPSSNHMIFLSFFLVDITVDIQVDKVGYLLGSILLIYSSELPPTN